MLLINEGYCVLDLSLRKEPGVRFNPDPRTWGRVSARDLTWLFSQLSTLIGAGVPLIRSLDILEEQAAGHPLKVALAGVYKDLERGESLSKALALRQEIFPPIATHMIRSGEAGGVLEEVLQRLAVYLEKEQELVKQVKSATLYPALLASFAFCVVFFLLGYVVPRLTQAFHYDISTLPVVTQVILSLGEGMGYWLGPVVISIIGMGVALKCYRRTPAGRIITDRLFLTLPLVGSIVSKLAVTRFANNMGILVQSGLNIIEALEVSETITGNAVLAGAIRNARKSVHRGRSIADVFRISGIFDPLVIQMVTIGEETGRLDESLLKVAGYYEAETEHLIKSGVSLLEPILIIIMALVVGLIVSGTILPMLDMMTVF